MIPTAIKIMIATCAALIATDMALSIFALHRIETKILVFATFFYFPPALYLKTRGAATLARLVLQFFFGCVMWAVGLAVAFAVHHLSTEEYLVGDALHTWMEMARAAAALWLLPLLFAFIRPPGEELRAGREADEDGEDFDRVPNDGPVTLALPGGVVVGVAFLPGSVAELVGGSRQGRATMKAYCSFVALVCSTLAAAAAAAWFDLVAAETTLAYLYMAAMASVIYSLPRLFFPVVNNRYATRMLWWVMMPVFLAATPYVTALEKGPKHIEDLFFIVRTIAWWTIMPYSSKM